MFNAIHPRIKNVSNYYAIDHILAAIGWSAVTDQVYRKEIDPSEAAAIVEEYISIIKGKVYEKKEEPEKKAPDAEKPAKKAVPAKKAAAPKKKAAKKKRGSYKKKTS